MPSEDYFPEADSNESTPDAAPQSNDTDYETFLVPKAAFGKEVNPGDTETVEIVHVYEDEVECRCTGGEDKPSGKSKMDQAMDDMGSMSMKEG